MKKQSEINNILSEYYAHISDLLVEPFLMSSCTKEEAKNYVEYKGIEELQSKFKEGKDAIVMMGHYGNWEFLSTLPMYSDYNIVIAYTPLANARANHIMKSIRGKFKVTLVPKNQFLRYFLKNDSSKPSLYLIIADQNPERKYIKHFIEFFNQKIPIQVGVELMAKKKNAAIFFLNSSKRSRFTYQYQFELLFESSQSCEKFEIVSSFYQKLEEKIIENPAYWLWSHKRFKYVE